MRLDLDLFVNDNNMLGIESCVCGECRNRTRPRHKIPRLVNTFPESLRSITFYGSVCIEDFESLLLDFRWFAVINVPNLTRITFEDAHVDKSGPSSMQAQVWERDLADLGVVLEVPWLEGNM